MGKKYTTDKINIGGHSLDAAVMTELDALIANGTASLSYDFPIEAGQTINENDFVMLNDNGGIFEVESTGSVPITIPIGSAEYSQTLAPSQDRDNLVRFIDNNENFIMFCYAGYNVWSFFQGGRVDSLGNFTYLNSPASTNQNVSYIEFDIDETTFGQPVVNGCASYAKSNGRNIYGMAFEYTVATQTFVFGTELDFGVMGSMNSMGNITNVGAGKYIISSSRERVTFIATVSNLAITKQANTAIPSNREKGHFIKISNDKVIWLVLSASYNQDAYIFNISGNVITVGNKSSSTWDNYNFSVATRQIDSKSQFYMCSPGTGMSQNHFVSQQTYDSVNDIVVFNENRLELDTDIYVTDMAYNPSTNIVVLSGASGGIPVAAIVDFASSSIINKTVGVSSGIHNGSAINSQGDIVFNYNNSNKGTTTYGKLGDILSNLDPVKVIGVASNGLGSVKINGSVITNPQFNLAINQKVYVDGQGFMSTVKSDGSLYIGFAISSTSFILVISR